MCVRPRLPSRSRCGRRAGECLGRRSCRQWEGLGCAAAAGGGGGGAVLAAVSGGLWEKDLGHGVKTGLVPVVRLADRFCWYNSAGTLLA